MNCLSLKNPIIKLKSESKSCLETNTNAKESEITHTSTYIYKCM